MSVEYLWETHFILFYYNKGLFGAGKLSRTPNNKGECDELPDQLPEKMFLHPKLIFNAPRIAMEQFMDPHMTCED